MRHKVRSHEGAPEISCTVKLGARLVCIQNFSQYVLPRFIRQKEGHRSTQRPENQATRPGMRTIALHSAVCQHGVVRAVTRANGRSKRR